MKIAIIGTTAAMMINFRQDLIKTLLEKQYKVYALALDYTLETRENITSMGAIPIDYTFSKTGLNPISDFINTIKLYRLLKKIQPDLVFSYVAKPVIFGTIAAKLAGIKKRYGMIEGLGYSFTHTPEKNSLKKNIIKYAQIFLYRLSVPLLHRLIVLNKDDQNDLLVSYKVKATDCQILGGIGVNLHDFPHTPVKENSPVSFIFIARLLKEKGIYEYVGAAENIKKKYPTTRFIVLGGLDLQNPGSLQQDEIDQLIANNIITYPGQVTNVSKWIQQSHVFVLPSYREGMPRSTQEAMAIGRAIITTDVPGCRDTVINGKNGFLIPPLDTKALENAMESFIINPDLIQSMGEASYQIAKQKYDAVEVNQRLLKLLDL